MGEGNRNRSRDAWSETIADLSEGIPVTFRFEYVFSSCWFYWLRHSGNPLLLLGFLKMPWHEHMMKSFLAGVRPWYICRMMMRTKVSPQNFHRSDRSRDQTQRQVTSSYTTSRTTDARNKSHQFLGRPLLILGRCWLFSSPTIYMGEQK